MIHPPYRQRGPGEVRVKQGGTAEATLRPFGAESFLVLGGQDGRTGGYKVAALGRREGRLGG